MHVIFDQYLHCDKDASVADTEYNGYVNTNHRGWVMIVKKTSTATSETFRYYVAKGDYATIWAGRAGFAYSVTQ